MQTTQTPSDTGPRPLEPALAVPAFTGGVRVFFASGGDVATLAGPATSLALRPVRGGVRTALERLAEGPLPAAELYEGLRPAERVQFERVLDRARHLVAHAVLARGGSRELLRLEPVARDAAHVPVRVPADATVRLSRFAFCRSREGALVLESPLVKYRAVLTDPAARTLAAALGEPGTSDRLGAAAGLDEAGTADVLGHLVGAGFAELADEEGVFASDGEPVLRQWDFHDLLFHSRVRSGRYDEVFGAVYPHRGAIEPRPHGTARPRGPLRTAPPADAGGDRRARSVPHHGDRDPAVHPRLRRPGDDRPPARRVPLPRGPRPRPLHPGARQRP